MAYHNPASKKWWVCFFHICHILDIPDHKENGKECIKAIAVIHEKKLLIEVGCHGLTNGQAVKVKAKQHKRGQPTSVKSLGSLEGESPQGFLKSQNPKLIKPNLTEPF